MNWCFTSTNILRHLKKKPIEEEEKNEEGQVFKCRVCYQMLTNNTALKRHFEYLHSKVFKCEKEECSFEGSRWKLLLHTKVHLGVFSCETCFKSFPQQAQLDFHKASHSDITDFDCEKCNKAFKTAIPLKVNKYFDC